MTADVTETFQAHRGILLGAAYRILGTHADAEDVVQEAWIRWSAVDPQTIDHARAYLLTITSRLALNRLRHLKARRESYVGPWLPEPVATGPAVEGAAAAVLAEEVSMALLIVLESLSPLERAAFVLSDVFGMSSDEVAEALERSPAAVRQLLHRARSHVEARQPRHVVDVRHHRAVVDRFVAAATEGDVEGLLGVLSPDVILVTDGGGLRPAALRPLHTAAKVVRFLLGVLATPEAAALTHEYREINGELAVVASGSDGTDSVFFFTVEDDRISEVHVIRNPEKLTAV